MRDVARHRGRDRPRTTLAPPIEVRVRSVRVAVGFAQVEIDSRREQSAEDRVHDHGREIIGVATWQSDVSQPQLGLRRVGLADDVHGACSAGWRIRCRHRHR